jgi:hypothetical protein
MTFAIMKKLRLRITLVLFQNFFVRYPEMQSQLCSYETMNTQMDRLPNDAFNNVWRDLTALMTIVSEFHHQADAKWIIIRPLRGHNDAPCMWPTPGRPFGRPGVGRP